MKYRNDFVTNSSSESFICDFCGAEASGWDLSLGEAEMVECENGHTICEADLDDKTLNYLLDTYDDEDSPQYWEDWRYEMPEKYCPICNFKGFLDKDLLSYICKAHNINLDNIKQEISENFKKYSDFKNFLEN